MSQKSCKLVQAFWRHVLDVVALFFWAAPYTQHCLHAAVALTSSTRTSGSAVTPHFFRSTSPILRVISSTPFTRGRPTLLHVMRPLQRSMRSRSLSNSGSWSSVSCSADALRHSSARLSPTCATASSAPFLITQTVAVLPLDCDNGAWPALQLVSPDTGISHDAFFRLFLSITISNTSTQPSNNY